MGNMEGGLREHERLGQHLDRIVSVTKKREIKNFKKVVDKELSKEYYSRQILINGTTKASEMILQSIVFGAFLFYKKLGRKKKYVFNNGVK